MAIEKAMWAHGHSMVIEYPNKIASERKLGFYYRVVGKSGTTNWFHFAIPTPVIVDNNRLSIDSALLRFRSKSTSADVTAVHVYDGEVKIDLEPQWTEPVPCELRTGAFQYPPAQEREMGHRHIGRHTVFRQNERQEHHRVRLRRSRFLSLACSILSERCGDAKVAE